MKKRIYKHEFNKALKGSGLSSKKREFLNKTFASDLVDGLTEWELNQKIQRLKYDTKDPIDQWDAEKVKNRLLDKMKK